MPIPVKLGITFTAAEMDAMKAGVQVVIDTIQSKIVVNLSNEERIMLSKVSDERLPYVQRSIGEYGLNYPQFNPLAYAYTDAKADLDTFVAIGDLLTKLTEATEQAEELQMLAGHFSFLFMRKQYDIVQSNVDQNVPGAQVVADGLKGAFEGQGPQGDTPAAP